MVEKKWYIIHALTGQEEKIKVNLENRIMQHEVQNEIFQILIPTEKISEVKNGKRKISERKFFPGYLLVEMELNKKTWHLIRNTPGVTGFIGSGRSPLPLKDEEIESILTQTKEKKEKPSPKVAFERGEAVRVKEGHFANFTGAIEEINAEKQKLKVMVSIFGRATPIELEYWQVEKV